MDCCDTRGNQPLGRCCRERAWLTQRNAAHARSLIAANPTWPKDCASDIIRGNGGKIIQSSALTYNVRSFYGLPNFPMIPDGWIAAQQRRQLHSCPRCSLPLADRSRFRCVFSVPLDKGGSASVDNLVLICRSCSMAPVGRLRTNDDDPISDGSPIRQQRMQSGLSLRLMSRQLGISAQYLSDIERGRRAVPADLPGKVDVSDCTLP